jgi:O-antigen/teichoic acid export membrane protein
MSASTQALEAPISSAKSSRQRISRARNILSNWGMFLFSAGVGFFLSPFVVHRLGDTAYGIWALLGSLVGYLGLLDLGVRGAVTRYIASSHSRGDHVEATRIASSALTVFTAAGALAISASVALAILVTRVFNVPPELAGVARVVLILGGINVAVSIISGVFGGVVIGLQRFDFSNGIDFGVEAIRAAAIVVALELNLGLVALASIQLVMSACRGLANYILSRRLYPELTVNFTECRRRQLYTIFAFSSSILILQASGVLILSSDSLVIGASLPVGMITFFAIAAGLVEYARAPVSGISQTLTPWISALEGGDEGDQLQRVLLAAARVSTLVVLPIVLTFIVRGHTFIGLWMGQEYAKPSGHVLWILSIALGFAAARQAVVSTMMGISKHHGLVIAFVVEALCNLGLSLLLVRQYGIVGVAWGTTVPRVIVSVAFTPWYVRRILGTRIKTFFLEVWVRPGVGMVLFVMAEYLIDRWWHPTNLGVFFLQVAMALPLAAAGAWALSLTRTERTRLLAYFRQRAGITG